MFTSRLGPFLLAVAACAPPGSGGDTAPDPGSEAGGSSLDDADFETPKDADDPDAFDCDALAMDDSVVPDFELRNADGEALRLHSLCNSVVLLTVGTMW